MGAGHVFHRRASAFDDPLDHTFVVFEMYSCDSFSERCAFEKELDLCLTDPHSAPTLV